MRLRSVSVSTNAQIFVNVTLTVCTALSSPWNLGLKWLSIPSHTRVFFSPRVGYASQKTKYKEYKHLIIFRRFLVISYCALLNFNFRMKT